MKCDTCENKSVCKEREYLINFMHGEIADTFADNCSGYEQHEEPMTNEEWLRSLDAEQLAKWIIDVTQYCFECGLNINNCLLCPFGKCGDVGSMVEWLKRPHTKE